MSAPAAAAARRPARPASAGLRATIVIVGVSLGVALWIYWIGGPGELRARYGVLGPAVSLAAHTAVNVTPVADLVPWAIANGALYGVALGSFLSWLAWLGSCTIQYTLARRTAADLDLAAHMDRLPRFLRRLPVHHPLFLIVGRFFPVGPLVVCVAAGLFGVPFRRLLWCTAVGAVPPAVGLALLGAGLFQHFFG